MYFVCKFLNETKNADNIPKKTKLNGRFKTEGNPDIQNVARRINFIRIIALSVVTPMKSLNKKAEKRASMESKNAGQNVFQVEKGVEKASEIKKEIGQAKESISYHKLRNWR